MPCGLLTPSERLLASVEQTRFVRSWSIRQSTHPIASTPVCSSVFHHCTLMTARLPTIPLLAHLIRARGHDRELGGDTAHGFGERKATQRGAQEERLRQDLRIDAQKDRLEIATWGSRRPLDAPRGGVLVMQY
jgi:hypothetical protein